MKRPLAALPPQVDRRRALLALLAVVVALGALLVAFRLTSGPGTAAVTATAPSTTTSSYAALFAQIRPDGTVSKETALEAFALAIAPLPGVTPPSGAAPTPTERLDGTFAIDWIRPYLDDLTPAQKAVVDAAIAPDPNAPIHPPTSSLDRFPVVLADATSTKAYESLIGSAIPVIATKLGRTLHLGWSVTLNTTQEESASTFAVTYATWFPLRGYSACSIHVNPLLANSTDAPVVSATMAHEIFHCFQYDWFDQHGGFKQLPEWIIEGQAEWVGEMVGGPSNAGKDWWGTYLTQPATPLWQRTYEAVGFYQHLAEEGIDPWTHIDAMLSQNTNVDAYQAAGASADVFLDTWASGLFRDQTLGDEWNAKGPWTLNAHAPPEQLTVASGETKDVATSVVVNKDIRVTSTADVVEVQMKGHVRIHTHPPSEETSTTDRWLCTKEGGCDCPPGEHFAGPKLESVASTFELGLTGSLNGANGTVAGHPLDEYCLPDRSPQVSPGTPCRTDCGHSNGDPHLRTVNRYKYDFQAAGEFVLLRSPDGSIEVQAREVPLADSAIPGVAVNTAIAARVNGHRVGVYVGSSGMVVRVDGAPVDIAATTDLGSGAALRPASGGVEVDFPDGSALWALSVLNYGINAVIQPSDALRAGGTGLLGPIVPGGLGVPALPDGTRLPAAPDAHQRHLTVYGPFADAWRVTGASSLFDYDPGMSTATFTDKTFPSETQETAQAHLPADRQAAGETACASITDPDLGPECVFDVAVSGDDGYARSYAPEQDLYDSGILAPTPTPSSAGAATRVADAVDVQPGAVGPDGTVYVSIDTPSQQAAILAIDPKAATVLHQLASPQATDLHFAAGSVWAAGQATDANGGHCTVTRFDASTLATIATLPVPCAAGFPGPRIVSTGTAVWFVDTTKLDTTAGTGATLTRIDPDTNKPGRSVALGYPGGCCQDSQGAVFCNCGGGGLSRLLEDATTFEPLGQYGQDYPAGTGFWTQQGETAIYVNGAGGPAISLPLTDQRVVGGDATGVYLQAGSPEVRLLRQPADGSPPVQVATAPVFGTGIDTTYPDYLSGGYPSFATARGFVHLWIQDKALYVQWAPLP